MHDYSLRKKPISVGEPDYSESVRAARRLILASLFYLTLIVMTIELFTPEKDKSLKPKGPLTGRSIFKMLFSETDDITE